MNHLATLRNENRNEAKGIQRIRRLPDPTLGALWDSIILDAALKEQLLSRAVLNFALRSKVDRAVLPLHGAILLVGPPGTGKTSRARGPAHRTAASFQTKGFRLLEVEPHALTSSAMGKTQRAVTDLFAQSIAEAAAAGPTIVLLDEVETLAADRSKLSLEANPADVHRATDAVLVQLDALADDHPNLLFLATSNFPQAADSAFTSRCDPVVNVPLPDRDACGRILEDCLAGLGKTFPAIGKLVSSPKFDRCAAECVGLEDALHLLEIGAAAAVEVDAAPAALEELGVEMPLQGADAVADGGGGDAELLAGQHEALVPGSGLEEAQAFERRKVEHGEGPGEARWENVTMSSHIRALQASSGAAAPPAGRGLQRPRRRLRSPWRSVMPWMSRRMRRTSS